MAVNIRGIARNVRFFREPFRPDYRLRGYVETLIFDVVTPMERDPDINQVQMRANSVDRNGLYDDDEVQLVGNRGSDGIVRTRTVENLSRGIRVQARGRSLIDSLLPVSIDLVPFLPVVLAGPAIGFALKAPFRPGRAMISPEKDYFGVVIYEHRSVVEGKNRAQSVLWRFTLEEVDGEENCDALFAGHSFSGQFVVGNNVRAHGRRNGNRELVCDVVENLDTGSLVRPEFRRFR